MAGQVSRSRADDQQKLERPLCSSGYALNLHQIITDGSIKVDNLNLQSNELSSEVDEALELISSDKPPIIPTESPASTFLIVAEELDNRERRKNNVIIYNLPKTSLSQDEKWFADLCKGVFDIGVKITKILQLANLLRKKLGHYTCCNR